jgi:hypothetical protein
MQGSRLRVLSSPAQRDESWQSGGSSPALRQIPGYSRLPSLCDEHPPGSRDTAPRSPVINLLAALLQCLTSAPSLLQPTTLAPCPRLGRLPLIRPLRPQCPMSLPKLNRPQRADYSCERRRTERPAEWTPAPHLMGSGAWDTPVLTCAESSRNGIDSGWGETPFLSENKPSRRLPLVPVMESTDFRKLEYGTELRRLKGGVIQESLCRAPGECASAGNM